VSIILKHYCTGDHSTFSRTLDFPSGGGIADDSVVPNNNSVTGMTRKDLFMSARLANKLYTNMKHKTNCRFTKFNDFNSQKMAKTLNVCRHMQIMPPPPQPFYGPFPGLPG